MNQIIFKRIAFNIAPLTFNSVFKLLIKIHNVIYWCYYYRSHFYVLCERQIIIYAVLFAVLYTISVITVWVLSPLPNWTYKNALWILWCARRKGFKSTILTCGIPDKQGRMLYGNIIWDRTTSLTTFNLVKYYYKSVVFAKWC